ncbi:hypothetical protein TWF102_002203 [Orbilia oligospora]|uniref:RNB domain-containing protein n=1 Tax=Orbilia oligospora TaxID=2813651 RepID=A0A7C8JAP8_ORBOL|nr:hypothetical protein TWF102_002203 [Orbilia oligospora]KAF3088444.1 hypothetical protein TWF103_001131 [Orbilia oligospora]KAF3092891.1 hypothetical protein TWF706_008883 [Orbilia oligospora]KAF3135626.1 hypothetical protein TWF594_008350 [Orbilia oligospora]
MSLQCPRCTFIATLRTWRPRQLPHHARLILPTIPSRTLTTTLPLDRSVTARRRYEKSRQDKEEQTEQNIVDILQRIEELEPGGTLTIHEDEERFMNGVYQHYQMNDEKIPKFKLEVIKRRAVEFLDDGGLSASPKIRGGRITFGETMESKYPNASKKKSDRGGKDSDPRQLGLENQGSHFTAFRPNLAKEIFAPRGPDPEQMGSRRFRATSPPIVYENQVSTPTMREKLMNEWRKKEEAHKIAYNKGTSVDVILEKIRENAVWQEEAAEEDASVDASSGGGYDNAYDLDPEAYASRNVDLVPGSLVEVRYTDASVPFLAIFLKNKTGNYSRDSFVLSPQGAILITAVDMSRFTLPGFIPVEQVDELLKDTQTTGRLNADLVRNMITLVREFRARVHLRYPTFNARIDKLHTELLSRSGSDEEGTKVVTTDEVARMMIGEADPSKEDRYAAHIALFARRDLFTVGEGWGEETVWNVKSLEGVERAKRIERLIRDSIADKDSEGGKIVHGFVRKAREIIDLSRRARKEGKSADEVKNELTVEWTDEEMELLRALEEALEYRRGLSVTLKSLYPHVLGLLNRYDKGKLLDEQRLFEFLGEVGVCSPWEDSVLRERELGLPGHRATVEAEDDGKLYDNIEKEEGSVEKLGLKDIMEGLRHDWGDMPVYCVDDAETKDIDDGVSLEEIKDSKDVWLHVHVANPTAFLPLDHWISEIAAKRTQTFYGPARSYSMVPLRLSVEKLGLAPNRPAMTFSIRVDRETGEHKDIQIRASTVKNVKRVSYAYMDKLLGVTAAETVVLSNKPQSEKTEEPEPDVNEKDLEILRNFHKLGYRLLQRRVRNGCMEVSKQASLDIIVDNGHGNEIHPGLLKKPVLDVYEPTITLKFSELTRSKETFSSASAIREAMTMAGEAAAVWSNQRGLMQMYRQHAFIWPSKAEEKKWLDLLAKAKGEDGIIPLDFWKLYFPAGGSKITPRMERHMALGLDGYVKVTSPLRRFADFVSHHIIQRQILAEHEEYKGDREALKKPMFTETEIMNFCKDIRHREQILKSADNATLRLWSIRLLKQLWKARDPRLPEEVDIEIISVATHPTPVSGEIKGLGVSGARVYLPGNIGKSVKYGDVVKGKISPWHWSTDSNNAQIVAFEYIDFVKPMSDVRSEFFERIGEGVRWE